MHTNRVECGQLETYRRLTSKFVSSASQIHFSMSDIHNPNLGEEAGFAARWGSWGQIDISKLFGPDRPAPSAAQIIETDSMRLKCNPDSSA